MNRSSQTIINYTLLSETGVPYDHLKRMQNQIICIILCLAGNPVSEPFPFPGQAV